MYGKEQTPSAHPPLLAAEEGEGAGFHLGGLWGEAFGNDCHALCPVRSLPSYHVYVGACDLVFAVLQVLAASLAFCATSNGDSPTSQQGSILSSKGLYLLITHSVSPQSRTTDWGDPKMQDSSLHIVGDFVTCSLWTLLKKLLTNPQICFCNYYKL